MVKEIAKEWWKHAQSVLQQALVVKYALKTSKFDL
jgi:hypothetical protein